MSPLWRNVRGMKGLGNHFRWWLTGIDTGEITILGQLWAPESLQLCAAPAG